MMVADADTRRRALDYLRTAPPDDFVEAWNASLPDPGHRIVPMPELGHLARGISAHALVTEAVGSHDAGLFDPDDAWAYYDADWRLASFTGVLDRNSPIDPDFALGVAESPDGFPVAAPEDPVPGLADEVCALFDDADGPVRAGVAAFARALMDDPGLMEGCRSSHRELRDELASRGRTDEARAVGVLLGLEGSLDYFDRTRPVEVEVVRDRR